MQILDILSLAVGIAGVSVIIWGVLTTLHSMIKLELRRLKKENICKKREYLRHHLGSYLLLGLELLIAADIIHTIIDPDINDLIVLGSIVVIRTIISYFLNKELSGSHDCTQDSTEAVKEKQL